MSEDYAIVVGINHYPGISSLKGAENDAQNFYDWLIDTNGGDVPPERIKLLKSSDFGTQDKNDFINAKPKLDDIKTFFYELIYLSVLKNDKRVGRRLYLFFSGHGIGELRDSALLMANASKVVAIPNFAGKKSANYLIKGGLFDEIVLFMDCCADEYKWGLEDPAFHHIVPNPARANQVKYYYVLATPYGTQTRESPNPENNRVEGLFTRALMKSLKGGMTNKNDEITSESLEISIDENLKKIIPPTQYTRPVFDYDRNNPIVFKALDNQTPNVLLKIDVNKFIDLEKLEIQTGQFEAVKTFSDFQDTFAQSADKASMDLSILLKPAIYQWVATFPDKEEKNFFIVNNTEDLLNVTI